MWPRRTARPEVIPDGPESKNLGSLRGPPPKWAPQNTQEYIRASPYIISATGNILGVFIIDLDEKYHPADIDFYTSWGCIRATLLLRGKSAERLASILAEAERDISFIELSVESRTCPISICATNQKGPVDIKLPKDFHGSAVIHMGSREGPVFSSELASNAEMVPFDKGSIFTIFTYSIRPEGATIRRGSDKLEIFTRSKEVSVGYA